jgi:hypothetical protein
MNKQLFLGIAAIIFCCHSGLEIVLGRLPSKSLVGNIGQGGKEGNAPYHLGKCRTPSCSVMRSEERVKHVILSFAPPG